MARRAAVALMVVALTTGAALADSFTPFVNHTVGGEAGWIYNATRNKALVDYPLWASKISFFVGDYLIFKSDGSSTVIQTYNKTTYHLCSLDQDYGNLTSQWTSENEDGGDGDGNGGDSVPVLLSRDGENFFFSNADNGAQCRNGMKFQILVLERKEKPSTSLLPAAPPPSATEKVNASRQREAQLSGGGPQGRRLWTLSCFVGVLPLLFLSG